MASTDLPACSYDEQAGHVITLSPSVLRHALRSGGQYGYVFFEHTSRTRASIRQHFSGRRLMLPTRQIEHHLSTGAAVHAFGDRHAGYGWTQVVTRNALQQAAEHARRRARGAGPTVMPVRPGIVPDLLLPADSPDQVDSGEKQILIEDVVGAAFSIGPDVVSVRADYRDRVRRILVVNSDGRVVRTVTMLSSLRLEVTLRSGTSGYSVMSISGGFGRVHAKGIERMAIDAFEHARHRESSRNVPGGYVPVIFAGGTGGAWLHESLGHLLEADVATSRRAAVQVEPGQRLSSLPITVYDDPLLVDGRGSARFDDEGEDHTRTVLLADGVVTTFMTDRRMAARHGLPLSANGRRQDFAHSPMPRMTNFVMAPGAADPGDLVASVARGVFVRSTGKATLQDGRFTLEVTDGNLVENGRITAPACDFVVHGSTAEILAGLQGIGSDLVLESNRGQCVKRGQVVPVSTATPTVLIEALEVGPLLSPGDRKD